MRKVPNRSARQGRQDIKKTEGNHRISQAKNNRLIVVLGMHRSGTSIVTRGLQVLGVDLGDNLMPPIKGENDKGYWEDLDLVALNEEMLCAIGNHWYDLKYINSFDIAVLKKQGYFILAVQLLRQKVISTSPFGFKDPRVAKLLPFWEEVFEHCKFEVSYVFAVRHPLSVVKSLKKRDYMEPTQSYLLWLSHIITSLTANIFSKSILIDYDCLMLSPDKELNRIAIAFDLKIDQSALLTYKTDFLDNGLRHTTYELDDLFLDDTCPPIAAEIYKSLLQIASDKIKFDDIDLCSDIERWRKEFDRLECSLVLVDTLIEQKKVDKQLIINNEGQIVGLTEVVAERDALLNAKDEAWTSRVEQTASDFEAEIARIACERDALLNAKDEAWPKRLDQTARKIVFILFKK